MKKLILTLAIVAGTAHAGIIDGNTLHKHLSDAASSHVSWGFAHGYVAGVNDANDGTMFCTPVKATVGQMTEMVKVFMDTTPAIRHMPADAIITYVFQKSWPCPKKGGSL